MNHSKEYWRGDLRIAPLLFALVVAAACLSASVQAATTQSQAYTIRLTVSKAGFEPGRIAAPIGTVRFIVTSLDGDHCFAIPALDVEKRVRTASPLEVDVSFERVGEFPFLCCVEGEGSAEVGVIVVAPAS